MSEVALNDSNFEAEVVEKSKSMPVLVDIWAPWCPPCRLMGPIVEELAKEYDGKVAVGKYNADESSVMATKLGVMGIPAFFVYKNGAVVDQWTGAMEKSEVAKRLDKAIG